MLRQVYSIYSFLTYQSGQRVKNGTSETRSVTSSAATTREAFHPALLNFFLNLSNLWLSSVVITPHHSREGASSAQDSPTASFMRSLPQYQPLLPSVIPPRATVGIIDFLIQNFLYWFRRLCY